MVKSSRHHLLHCTKKSEFVLNALDAHSGEMPIAIGYIWHHLTVREGFLEINVTSSHFLHWMINLYLEIM